MEDGHHHHHEQRLTERQSSLKRISPLRGLSHDDILSQTRVVRNGLSSLRDDHYHVLARIRDEYEDKRNANSNDNSLQTTNGKAANVNAADTGLLEDRISNVTRSLEQLEIGIDESSVLLSLSDHFEHLETERMTTRLEMGRVQDENDWLREELADVQKKFQQTLLELTELQEEKRKWEFEEELKRNLTESNVRPITPSKIPVGAYRVEEEKNINRALNGDMFGSTSSLASSSGSRSRAVSPGPSRIPTGSWRSKLSVYKNVMEKESQKASQRQTARDSSAGGGKGRQYFKLNAGKSKIPSR